MITLLFIIQQSKMLCFLHLKAYLLKVHQVTIKVYCMYAFSNFFCHKNKIINENVFFSSKSIEKK